MGRAGDEATVKEAQYRFAHSFFGGPPLEAGLRATVLAIVAENADGLIWDQLHMLAKSASSAIEKADYYRLLGAAKDPVLVDKALALSISGEMETTTAPGIVRRVSMSHPMTALTFAIEHWSTLQPMLETMAQNRYMPALAAPSSDLAILKPLSDFAKAHIPATGDGELRKTEAGIRSNAETRRRTLPDIDRWMATNSGM